MATKAAKEKAPETTADEAPRALVTKADVAVHMFDSIRGAQHSEAAVLDIVRRIMARADELGV